MCTCTMAYLLRELPPQTAWKQICVTSRLVIPHILDGRKDSQAANPAAIHTHEQRERHRWCEWWIKDWHVSDAFDFRDDITEHP